jgi:hypothetical protein
MLLKPAIEQAIRQIVAVLHDFHPADRKWLVKALVEDVRFAPLLPDAPVTPLQTCAVGSVPEAKWVIEEAIRLHDIDAQVFARTKAGAEWRRRAAAVLTQLHSERQPVGGVPEDIERLCAIHHDAYEAAARARGWSTNLARRCAWEDLPEANKDTMRAAMRCLLSHLYGPVAQLVEPPAHNGLVVGSIPAGTTTEESLVAAYLRGVDWAYENGHEAKPYANKAAWDYADATLSLRAQRKASDDGVTASPISQDGSIEAAPLSEGGK